MSSPSRIGRRLGVRHETSYHYDTPVEVGQHSAWLRPRDTQDQQVRSWRLDVRPEPDTPVQEDQDVFGNWRHGFSHSRVHDRLCVLSAFEVELFEPRRFEASSGPTWEQTAEALSYRAGIQQPDAAEFALGTSFAPRDWQLRSFGAADFAPGRPLLEAALALMWRVHAEMTYQSNSTNVATSATQALALGRGVCQDFAHLLIGVLRSFGLAARYVSGYLLTQPPPGQARLIGADASHAWVAVWCPGHDWVALDPTNNVVTGTDHVTLGWGRDYSDVAPLRGVIRGGGLTPPQVAVTVQPC